MDSTLGNSPHFAFHSPVERTFQLSTKIGNFPRKLSNPESISKGLHTCSTRLDIPVSWHMILHKWHWVTNVMTLECLVSWQMTLNIICQVSLTVSWYWNVYTRLLNFKDFPLSAIFPENGKLSGTLPDRQYYAICIQIPQNIYRGHGIYTGVDCCYLSFNADQ